MPYPNTTFNNFQELMEYINTYWITNGVEEITGAIGNDVVNGLLSFTEQSPLNWQKADIQSLGGDISAARPITVFMTTAPDSLSWADNIYYEYVFINTTFDDIPTTTPYYDINLTAINVIPAKSIINICKAKNNLWLLKSLPASGSGVIVPALNGIVGGGGVDDPVDDSPTFQSNKLIGLGATNGGKVSITYAETPMSNYGGNASFAIDNVAGIFTWTNGNTFSTGSSLYINLNQ